MGVDTNLLVKEQSVPADLFCSVCQDLVDPADALVTPCAHLYCRQCIHRSLSTSSLSCPSCTSPLHVNQLKPIKEANRLVYRILTRCAVRCPHSGCDWRGELSDLRNHTSKCTNVSALCKHCGERIPQREKARHDAACGNTEIRTLKVQADQIRRLLNSNSTASLVDDVRRLVVNEQAARAAAHVEATRRLAAEQALQRIQQAQAQQEAALNSVSYHYRTSDDLTELGCFLSRHAESPPPQLEQNRMFVCIQRCVQDVLRYRCSLELYINTWFVLSAAYQCRWFTDNQRCRMLDWMREHTTASMDFEEERTYEYDDQYDDQYSWPSS